VGFNFHIFNLFQVVASSQALALFDFDGTLTKKDSLLEFLFFYFGKLETLGKVVAFLPKYFYVGILKKDKSLAKEKLTSLFFKGVEIKSFNQKCLEFSTQIIPTLILDQAMNKLNWHLSQNHEVCIVSASYKNYLLPFFESIGVKVISTELEVIEGKLSGRFISCNCNGEEKAKRINDSFHLEKYTSVYAYGNSSGDSAMLGLANKKFYRPFRVQ